MLILRDWAPIIPQQSFFEKGEKQKSAAQENWFEHQFAYFCEEVNIFLQQQKKYPITVDTVQKHLTTLSRCGEILSY